MYFFKDCVVVAGEGVGGCGLEWKLVCVCRWGCVCVGWECMYDVSDVGGWVFVGDSWEGFCLHIREFKRGGSSLSWVLLNYLTILHVQ